MALTALRRVRILGPYKNKVRVFAQVAVVRAVSNAAALKARDPHGGLN